LSRYPKILMKWKTGKKRETGFTLLEIMITLAIIGIALVAILRSLGMSMDVSNESRNISIATFLAKGKMAEIESQGFPETGETNGDFGDENPGFRWEKSISRIEIEGLRKIVVNILWGEGKSEKKVELVTLISKR